MIPDSDHTPLVPNIGIIVGARATLVIDTGFGPDNARAVMQEARRLSAGRPVYLTHTHCHPEHGFGANVIAGEVTIVYNEAQWNELQEKGSVLLRMFRNQIPSLAPMLDGVEFVRPHIRYTGLLTLDLGDGQIVEFREFGGAHSRGDQGILVRGSKSVLFTGDLIEERYFGILGDSESHVLPWIDRLNRFEQLNPEVVVPGHGHMGGRELIANYRAYFEHAKRRVDELRTAGELPEADIVERVTAELLDLHPGLGQPELGKKSGSRSRMAIAGVNQGDVMKNSELISFGPVHLEIRDLNQSVKFWQDLVGLHQLELTANSAVLGIDGAPLVVLHRVASSPVQRGYSGLYPSRHPSAERARARTRTGASAGFRSSFWSQRSHRREIALPK